MGEAKMSALLKAIIAAAKADEDDAPELTHAEQIETLRAAAPRFARANPFAVGDLVTPVQGSDLKSIGAPHLVIATRDGGFDPRAGEPGSNAFALVPDLRVLVMTSREAVVAFWVRSENFESYVAPATPLSLDF
jgi:hypothetical protein